MTGTTTGRRADAMNSPSADDASIKDRAGDVAGSAVDTVKGVGSTLQDKAVERTSGMRSKVVENVDGRRETLAETARTIQDKAKEFASDVSKEQPQIGSTLEHVADSAGTVISYIERTPLEDMTSDISRQARQHPLLFAAGMFGVGFALSRAIKPVDPSVTAAPRQLGTGSTTTRPQAQTQALPRANALSGGMH